MRLAGKYYKGNKAGYEFVIKIVKVRPRKRKVLIKYVRADWDIRKTGQGGNTWHQYWALNQLMRGLEYIGNDPMIEEIYGN